MLFVAIKGSAPDCNWRARRAAPFTRLYLLWRGFSVDIFSTSGILPIYANRAYLSWPVYRWITGQKLPSQTRDSRRRGISDIASRHTKTLQRRKQSRRARLRQATLRNRRYPVAHTPLIQHHRAHLRRRLVEHIVDQRVLVVPHHLHFGVRLHQPPLNHRFVGHALSLATVAQPHLEHLTAGRHDED